MPAKWLHETESSLSWIDCEVVAGFETHRTSSKNSGHPLQLASDLSNVSIDSIFRGRHTSQQFFEGLRENRLDEVKVKTSLTRPAFDLFLASPGQGDHHNAFAPRLLPDAAALFVAI